LGGKNDRDFAVALKRLQAIKGKKLWGGQAGGEDLWTTG